MHACMKFLQNKGNGIITLVRFSQLTLTRMVIAGAQTPSWKPNRTLSSVILSPDLFSFSKPRISHICTVQMSVLPTLLVVVMT